MVSASSEATSITDKQIPYEFQITLIRVPNKSIISSTWILAILIMSYITIRLKLNRISYISNARYYWYQFWLNWTNLCINCNVASALGWYCMLKPWNVAKTFKPSDAIVVRRHGHNSPQWISSTAHTFPRMILMIKNWKCKLWTSKWKTRVEGTQKLNARFSPHV